MKALTDLKTLEVSNVRRAANKKRYAITKSETAMKTAIAVLSTPAEGEDKLIATLKSAGADDKRIEAETAAYRIKKGFADVLKADAPPAEEMTEEQKKAKKAAEEAAAMEAAESAVPAAKSAEMEAVMKSNADLVAKSAALEAMVKGLIDASKTQEYVSKAEKDFAHVPGSADEIAAVLKSAAAAGPETLKGIETILAQTNEIVSKSAMLQNFGVPGAGPGSHGSAWERIEQLAQQLTMKSDRGVEMTKEQKIAHVTTKTAEGRAAYREYLADHPAQRAKYNF